MGKPPDPPAVHVASNASEPGLVLVAIGSGTYPYNIVPKVAEALADELLSAAATARRTGGAA